MASSSEGEFRWDEFYKNYVAGGYYEFKYLDKYVNIGLETEGIFHKTEKWIFIVHKHDNNGWTIYTACQTPQDLLENARVDGKSLQEIWDDLILCE